MSTSALLQSYGGVSYAWSNGSNTSNTYVTPIENTTYTVTITGVNGCTKTDEVNVIINISYPSVELGEDKAIDCNTPNSTITASGGIAYIWSTGETSAVIIASPTMTTIYTVTVTGSNGCKTTDWITVAVDKLYQK
ncbi:MAG: hypothetical protein IPO14_04585 [Saprospiraceae bacterium]|nr:hypothetical protein [Saprospiraceae bacterium]